MSEEYIMGRNPVFEALRSEREISKIWIAEGSQKGYMQQVIGIAKERKCSCTNSTKKENRSNGRR